MGYAFTLTRDPSKTDPTTTTGTAIATIIVTPTNIGGTAGTIDIITIAIMIGIDAAYFALR